MALFYIDNAGLHFPDFSDIYSDLVSKYRNTFGADIDLDPDSIDGQWVGIIAELYSDMAGAISKAYDSFNPDTASGAALSRIVTINGISRRPATPSKVELKITVEANTTISAGRVRGADGEIWDLPSNLNYPLAGDYYVTATAENPGPIVALPNTITTIETPTAGWTDVTNETAASVGKEIESDAELRYRRALSVKIPSQTVLEGIQSAVLSLSGVTDCTVFENDTNSTVNGRPPHSIQVYVSGGADSEIAETINKKKAPGVQTFGSSSEVITDFNGFPKTIYFSRPNTQLPEIHLEVKGPDSTPIYLSAVQDAVFNALAAKIGSLKMGESIPVTTLANLAQDQIDSLCGAGFYISDFKVYEFAGDAQFRTFGTTFDVSIGYTPIFQNSNFTMIYGGLP